MFDQIEKDICLKKQASLFEQKKKYRNLQSDKKTYIDESVKVIKKQKMMVDQMRKENETLKDVISKMNRDTGSTNNFMTPEARQEELEKITESIQSEKEMQKTLGIHISNFQKKITEKKRSCGVNSGAENESNLQKQIKILQNRLDKANQKFNETTANNKQLKNLIDSFRRERVIFDNLYKKLEKELHEKRKRMADIIEKANNAYEERDKAQNQIQTLKVQAKREASEFEKQIKDMTYLMEKIKLSNYGKKNGKMNESFNNSLNFYERDPAMTSQPKNHKQNKKSSEQMGRIQKFREDFAKIEAATEIENFDQLLRIFSENEQKNFQMFKFVNLQSNEIEELEADVFQLKKQYEKACNDQENGDNKDSFVKGLEEHINNLKAELQSTKKQHLKNQSEIRPLSTHIQRMFETIECDREVVKEISGNKTISQGNLFVFLAIIEHKAIQIVSTFKQLSNPGIYSSPSRPMPVQGGLLTFDDFEDNEEYNKILTAQELRQKAKDFLEKEQNQKQRRKDIRNKKK